MNKLSKGLILSIIFHLILLFIIAQQIYHAPLPTVKKHNPVKPIQARLYFPSPKKQVTEAIKPEALEIETSTSIIEKVISTTPITVSPKKTEQKVGKTNLLPDKSPEPKIGKKVLTSKTSTKSIAQSSLEKLQQRLNNQALEHSQNDNFNKYLTDKNTIAQSTTKFNQLPAAKAKVKEVDCNGSAVNTAVMALSGLMGGSIRCNSMPNLKRFLDKRADERAQ